MKALASCRLSWRALHLAAEGADQRLRVELHVVEHLGDRVAVDEVGDLVAVRVAEAQVHGVGVAEEVVQVAQDLLVGAGQEDAEDVRLVRRDGVQLEALGWCGRR
jgi:hypothetical protein